MVDISLCFLSAMLMIVGGGLDIQCSSLAGGHTVSRSLHVKRSVYCPVLFGLKSATHLSEWLLFIVWVSPSIYCDSLQSGLV
ncbi:hypothetical protein MP228_003640 [Amoeboaphelidium protococcarum]|nr:hypothetical protein MP228_003640 [Amoeboaphelidium protococcarum]